MARRFFTLTSRTGIHITIADCPIYSNLCKAIGFEEITYILHNLQLSDEAKPADLWMLSRLSTVVEQCNESFSNTLQLYTATKALHGYWWGDFCDVYLVSFQLSNRKFSIVRSKVGTEAETMKK